MPRLRFSLRTFLLVLLFGSLIGSHLFTSWRLRHTLTENAEMRKELGRLEITDEDKVHLIAVPTSEDLLWRWRLYMPKGSGRHDVCVATHAISDKGFPESLGTIPLLPHEGEHVLTAAIRPDRSGEPRLTITWGTGSSTFGISESDARWFVENRGYASSLAGAAGTQEIFDPDKPIILLRLRAMETHAGGSASVSPDTPPGDGLMIWIQK